MLGLIYSFKKYYKSDGRMSLDTIQDILSLI